MRKRLLDFLKVHTGILQVFYFAGHYILRFVSWFLPVKKQMVYASFGGRNFDDSPRAIYDAICNEPSFDDWELLWAFVEPEKFDIPRGKKIKMDSIQFFIALLSSKVWVSNSEMDRNLCLCRSKTIDIETWHGTPIKKIGTDQNEGKSVSCRWKFREKGHKIRCAQSSYDLEIFKRVMNAPEEEFLLCDLPRNDELLKHSSDRVKAIKQELGISEEKKVILYMPTYREYLVDEKDACFLAPPINLSYWRNMLQHEYVLLFRAHYAVNKIMGVSENDFVKNVSDYPAINDLYMVSDILISDYSSAFVDFSILKRPMLCFAYDLEEYKTKRGLYMDLSDLPGGIYQEEGELIKAIQNMDYEHYSGLSEAFHMKYTPYAGNAAITVVNELKKCMEK